MLKRALGLSGRSLWNGCGLLVGALVCAVAFAQVVPPSLDVCANETDSGKRLACFDREIVRLHQLERGQRSGAATDGAQTSRSGASAGTSGLGAAGVPQRTGPSTQTGPNSSSMSSTPSAPPADSAAPPDAHDPAAIDRFGVTPDMQRERQIQGKAPTPLKEISAHIASVHYLPRGEIVVGLDNGQTWQQAEYDGDVSLDIGEPVTIKAGALSAFYLKPHRGRIVRVRRLR
jgi:hypothetical protein